jgi:hypothetical protein
MRPTPTTDTIETTETTTDTIRTGRRRPGRRTIRVLAAAAVVLVAVAAVLTFGPDGSQLSPAAALNQAADRTSDALTLRSDYLRDRGDGTFTLIRSEHHGADVRRTFLIVEADGTERTGEQGDEFIVYLGDKGWTAEAPDEPQTVDPAERNAPYAESSAAIVDAVSGAPVTEVGVEDVKGTDATHYRIEVDDAAIRRLSDLPPNQRSAFELEAPGQIRSLDVWIGDGYIRRLRVTQKFEPAGSLGTTVEFYDFGADITITPPG